MANNLVETIGLLSFGAFREVETLGLLSNRAVTVVSMPEEEWVWK